MGRNDEFQAVHPADPMNSYQPASWRGLIITAVLIIVVFAGLWLAYGAALNNPALQSQMNGQEQVQGDPFPGQPQPGN